MPHRSAIPGSTKSAPIVVLKLGGKALTDRRTLAKWVAALTGLDPARTGLVVVHGGGPQIAAQLTRQGIAVNQIDGLRVTNDATLAVVQSVLCGTVNKAIVAELSRAGIIAVGVSGQDGGLLLARKRGLKYGLVGRVRKVRPDLLHLLLRGGYLPVLAPLALDQDGGSLNVNADEAAAAIAAELKAELLLLLTDTEGVCNSAGETIERINVPDARRLIADGTIVGGMIPKVRCALVALAAGVQRCQIAAASDAAAIHAALRDCPGGGTCIIGSLRARAQSQQLP